MKTIKNIIMSSKNVLYMVFVSLIKFVSLFVPKIKTNIFCFPEAITCISNHVDIINYTADNTLSFLNFLLRNYNGTKLTVYLLYHYCDRLNDYENYVASLNNRNLHIIFILYGKSSLLNIKYIMKSKYIFSSNALEQRFPYKLKKQIYISLNYFATSFKLDKPKKSYKWPIEYVVSTSLLSSQIISNFSLVPLDNFLTLGFPRNDNILNPRYSREQIIKMLNVSFKIENIILHTPTHRIGHNISTKKNVIYYKDYREELNSILNEHNALLIIVSHPSEQLSLVEGKNDRIALYKPNFQYTLYDLIPHADALITDYTTVYYDFLLTNKPVIFNFYDKEIYEKERGFAFDPIENICAGIIVKNKKDLFSAIQQTLIGFDEYKQHRKFVTSLIHKYVDGNSSERISNFCKTVFNQ